MNNRALVVIDIKNDITKHFRDVIDIINAAIEWAVAEGMHIAYIKHNNTTNGSRTFKPGSNGEKLVPEMKVVSDNIFVKTKSNALTSEAFSAFISANGINEFYVLPEKGKQFHYDKLAINVIVEPSLQVPAEI